VCGAPMQAHSVHVQVSTINSLHLNSWWIHVEE